MSSFSVTRTSRDAEGCDSLGVRYSRVYVAESGIFLLAFLVMKFERTLAETRASFDA